MNQSWKFVYLYVHYLQTLIHLFQTTTTYICIPKTTIKKFRLPTPIIIMSGWYHQPLLCSTVFYRIPEHACSPIPREGAIALRGVLRGGCGGVTLPHSSNLSSKSCWCGQKKGRGEKRRKERRRERGEREERREKERKREKKGGKGRKGRKGKRNKSEKRIKKRGGLLQA